MAALSLADVKSYLRIAGTSEDVGLGALITASGDIVKKQTGKFYTSNGTAIDNDELFKVAQKQIIATWNANREEAVSGGVATLPHSAEAIIDIIKASTSYTAEVETGAGT